MYFLSLWWLFLYGNSLFVVCQLPEANMNARIYAIVNVIRSLWPRLDGKRICLFDSWISTPFVGRSLATISEVSFAVQVQEYTKIKGIIRTIMVAQWFCWMGVLTKNNMWHVAEESLWAITAARIVYKEKSVVALIYLMYMVAIDIPMYYYRPMDPIPMLNGFYEMNQCRIVYEWDIWREDVIWMTSYFVMGTQISLFMN